MTTARRLIASLSVLFLVPLLAVTLQPSAASAAEDPLFTPLSGFKPGAGADVRVRPREFRAYSVDLAGLRERLAGGANTSLVVPDPAGTLTTFTVAEDSVMEPELQAAHPEIRTYAGADGQGSSIRLDVTPMGFHAFVRRTDGVTWLVDPAYNRRGEDRVLSYPGGSSPATRTFVERELDEASQSVAPAAAGDGTDFSTPGGIVSQRTYRMAFLTDNTYATYFGSANVFSEKTTMMNRVNEVYNDDLAIKFVLINGTDTKLNLDTVAKMTGPNGPCGADACYTAAQVDDCGSDTLNRNNFVIGQIMGADTFDIGHIGVGNDGGGIAGLGVVGGTNKARGCTGLPTPDGDLYAIDYVAHEVGHQMGGNHTFNSQVCAGNRNGSTSVEPGSGSSIMAYAGICGADNLQPHSDPYFSERSVDEINSTTAASPTNLNERQSVAFLGLDAGEQIVLTCAGCGSQTVTWTGTSATDAAALTAAVGSVTGVAPVLTGYDGAATVTATGFTASWTNAADIKTLLVSAAAGSTFTAIVGTIVNGGPTTQGGAVSASTNHSPTVTAPVAKTIPMRTPFALTGSAADADGDTLTYMWEQNDAGAAASSLPSNTKTSGPLFRQFGTAAIVSATDTLQYNSPGENLAGTSPTRTFPDLAQVLAGNTNAATGACPASPPAGQTTVDCFSEFLPTTDYTGGVPGTKAMHFRLTARDEFTADAAADHPGGLSSADVTITVDSSAGPFLVTSRATAGAPASGTETVTWAVNGTATLAPDVKISLSTDGGLSYPTVLVASTPNDGSQGVILPSLTTSTARLKVEAVDNYFFDVNDANFSITPSGGNVAPLVDAGPDATVPAGTAFTRSGSFTDEAPGTATATVDYGDGAGPQALPLTGTTFSLNHTYATAGTKTVTVKVTDAGALSGTDSVTVTVTGGTNPPGQTASTTQAVAQPKKITKGKGFKALVTVTTASAVPAGTVQVYRGGKLLGTGTLAGGEVTIKVSKKLAKKLKVGKNTLTAKYLGSATVAPSQADFVIKVKKKKR